MRTWPILLLLLLAPALPADGLGAGVFLQAAARNSKALERFLTEDCGLQGELGPPRVLARPTWLAGRAVPRAAAQKEGWVIFAGFRKGEAAGAVRAVPSRMLHPSGGLSPTASPVTVGQVYVLRRDLTAHAVLTAEESRKIFDETLGVAARRLDEEPERPFLSARELRRGKKRLEARHVSGMVTLAGNGEKVWRTAYVVPREDGVLVGVRATRDYPEWPAGEEWFR